MNPLAVTIEQIAQAMGCQKRAAEIKAKREAWPYTEVPVRGGRKRYYEVGLLPAEVQPRILMELVNSGVITSQTTQTDSEQKTKQKTTERRPRESSYDRDALWAWYEKRSQNIKDEGLKRAGFCLKVRTLLDAGIKVRPALAEVARTEDVALATLKRWWYGDTVILGAANVDRADYAAALAPRYVGRQKRAEFSPEAWDHIKADWLRGSQPTVAAVYRRAQDKAAENGWVIPSLATVQRMLDALPWQVSVLAREGEEVFKRRLPHVTRLRSSLHALEVVNADGHKFDVNVQLPSGEVVRPMLVVWQDIYSGKILSYRIGETLNQHIVRLAFGDLVETYGVPNHAVLDNGREFANKWLTGRAKTRFRFKIREDDPIGIFVQLGIELHWTKPYHGQSKPIERAFRDLCENIAKHPACEGAYTGNSPVNKPHNYGSRAMDWNEFLDVVAWGIAEHNARTGRRTETANNRSFNDTFAESYSQSTIRKATAEQRRLWLLAAEGVKVLQTGHVAIQKNLYWGSSVAGHVGKKVIVRFDPEKLTDAVHIYDLTGEYLGAAECTQANFLDTQAGKDHARAERDIVKAAKDKLKAEAKKDAIEAAQQLPGRIVPLERPTSGATAPIFDPPRKVANGDYLPDDEFQTNAYVQAGEQKVLSLLDAWQKSQPQI